MRKSHKWEERPCIDIRCPYCRVWETYYDADYFINDIIGACKRCGKAFKLGRQK